MITPPPPPPLPRLAEFQHNDSAARDSPSLPTQAQRASPTPSAEVTKKDEGATKKSKFLDRIRSRRKDLAEKTLPLEDPMYSNDNSKFEDGSNQFDGNDEESSDNDDDESTLYDTRDERAPPSPSKKSDIWRHLDPLLVSFTNTFNSLTCGPITTADVEPDQKARKQEVKDHDEVDIDDDTCDEQDIFSGDETDAEERQDRGNVKRDMDNSFDHSDLLKEQFSSSSSCSNSTLDSSQVYRDLHSESLSEGEIQIRSSIRETMEKIVEKSKHGEEENADRTWLSYELRQDEDSAEVLHSPSRKNSRAQTETPKSKKNSLFRRNKNRQKS
jgi:hypothetical protein